MLDHEPGQQGGSDHLAQIGAHGVGALVLALGVLGRQTERQAPASGGLPDLAQHMGERAQQEQRAGHPGRGVAGQGEHQTGDRDAPRPRARGAGRRRWFVRPARGPDLEQHHGDGVGEQDGRDHPPRGVGAVQHPQRKDDVEQQIVHGQQPVQHDEGQIRPVPQHDQRGPRPGRLGGDGGQQQGEQPGGQIGGGVEDDGALVRRDRVDGQQQTGQRRAHGDADIARGPQIGAYRDAFLGRHEARHHGHPGAAARAVGDGLHADHGHVHGEAVHREQRRGQRPEGDEGPDLDGTRSDPVGQMAGRGADRQCHAGRDADADAELAGRQVQDGDRVDGVERHPQALAQGVDQGDSGEDARGTLCREQPAQHGRAALSSFSAHVRIANMPHPSRPAPLPATRFGYFPVDSRPRLSASRDLSKRGFRAAVQEYTCGAGHIRATL